MAIRGTCSAFAIGSAERFYPLDPMGLCVSPALFGEGSISRLSAIRVEALDQGFDPSEAITDLYESNLFFRSVVSLVVEVSAQSVKFGIHRPEEFGQLSESSVEVCPYLPIRRGRPPLLLRDPVAKFLDHT